MRPRYLVTGGAGFLGVALVRRLVQKGYPVRVLDNGFRGSLRRLEDIKGRFQFIAADIRDARAVSRAMSGVDGVWHLAYVNGTEHFYRQPQLVLEVAIKGILNVLEACRDRGVKEFFLASSSEVYQTPLKVPTDETAPLIVPDPHNPRYSYGAGKIISELMALHCGIKSLKRVIIFRPHNVYGPDMGFEHVIPQFIARMLELRRKTRRGPIPFPIQGNGRQTRAFVHIDDMIDGLMLLLSSGKHAHIYHVGNPEEISMGDLAREVGRCLGKRIKIIPGKPLPGSTPRRCPDIRKMRALGYRPKIPLREGLPDVAHWYEQNLP